MESLNEFLAAKTENQNESTAKTYENFYRRMVTFFPENKKPIDFTRSDFMRILQNMNATSAGTFTVAKSYMRDWIQWMIDRGEMKQNQLDVLTKIQYCNLDYTDTYKPYYFRNFDELWESLDQSIELHLEGDLDNDGEFDTFRCAVYLSWYGFTLNEIVEILKSDISPTDPIVYRGEEHIPVRIGDKAMGYIREYAAKESFRSRKFGRPDGVEMRYKDSQYLFRSCKSAKMNPNQISAMTRYTNPFFDEIGKHFAFNKIYLSGVYYRIYLDEQENGTLKSTDFDRLARLFSVPQEQLSIKSKKYDLSSRKYQQYLKYKEAFYPEAL